MAKTKPKPTAETERKPGRSRFSIPRKEAPPIDGSYLDHLFADFQQKSAELPPFPVTPQQTPPAPVSQPSTTPDEAPSGPATDTNSLPSTDAIQPVNPPDVRPITQSEPLTDDKTEAGSEFFEKNLKKISLAEKTFSPPATESELPATEPEQLSETIEPTETEPEQLSETTARSATELEQLFRLTKQFRLSKGEVSIVQLMLDLCHERNTDTCYIKIPDLSQAAQLSHRQTQRILLRLQETGIIEKLADYSNADKLGTQFRLMLAEHS